MALNAIIHRRDPPWWEQFYQAPYTVLAETLYSYRQSVILQEQRQIRPLLGLTVVCISDTHNSQPELPPGDLLLHAGDLTQKGSLEELQIQLDWLNAQPHTHKVVIAGNHDIILDEDACARHGMDHRGRQSLRWGSIIYLDKAAVSLTFRGGARLTVYGHPGTRQHGNWAFQYSKGSDVFTNQVDDGVDILLTHSPPQFHLDVAGWGDIYLLRELWRVKPRLHVFGHIHAGHGKERLVYDRFEDLYEQIRSGTVGLLAMIQMALLLLHMLLLAGPDRFETHTTLVNASVVGGLTDTEQRKPQTVQL